MTGDVGDQQITPAKRSQLASFVGSIGTIPTGFDGAILNVFAHGLGSKPLAQARSITSGVYVTGVWSDATYVHVSVLNNTGTSPNLILEISCW